MIVIVIFSEPQVLSVPRVIYFGQLRETNQQNLGAQWGFYDPHMQEPNRAAQGLYGTLQFP